MYLISSSIAMRLYNAIFVSLVYLQLQERYSACKNQDYDPQDEEFIKPSEDILSKVSVDDVLKAFEKDDRERFMLPHVFYNNLDPSDKNRTREELNKYNNGIRAIGIDTFKSASMKFCRDQADEGVAEIVSIGSGDGIIEEEIIAAYRDRFGNDPIQILFVDRDSETDVDYNTVDDLIEKRPQIVGNCSLFIIWPLPENKNNLNNYYDIEAIRKLRPRAVLTVYECVCSSGSVEFRIFLRSKDCYKLSKDEYGTVNFEGDESMRSHGGRCAETNCGVTDNYTIDEVAIRKIHLGKIMGTAVFRMVILRRTDEC